MPRKTGDAFNRDTPRNTIGEFAPKPDGPAPHTGRAPMPYEKPADTFEQVIAATPEGLREYESLAETTRDTAEQWQALADAYQGRGANRLEDIGEYLNERAGQPLRPSIDGIPLDPHADPDPHSLYRETYVRRLQCADIAKSMEDRFFHDPNRLIVDDATAIRYLTWQQRDLSDEEQALERIIGADEAKRIRDEIDPRPPRRPWSPSGRPRPRFTKSELANPKDVYTEIALLQRRDPLEVRASVRRRIDRGMDPVEALAGEYGSREPTGSVTGIDLETTGLSPRDACIVDAGWETYDMGSGRAWDACRRSYGLPPQRARLGVPARCVELNGIDATALRGLVPFQEDARAQRELLDALDGRIMVAHNARFERSFLIGNCAGYAEALRDGRIRILDSLKVAQHSDDWRARGFRLDDYARRHGALDGDRCRRVPAAGGGYLELDQGDAERHLGLEDTHIMLVAMRGQLRGLNARRERGGRIVVDRLD